ncbi:MAG: hypothetical protein JSR18_01590 [Proteobacteria bacterium]|nr:hypothetical protein [Pseudomonadota bacterium]
MITRQHRRGRRRQSGAFLLEALIAILIIAFGVLGLVGLQAQSMRHVNDAQFRAEAAYYAASLTARMWAHDPTAVQSYFGSSGAGFTDFKNQIVAAGTGLPNASANPPTITFDNTATNARNSSIATITINWQYPGETQWHTYTTQAVVGTNAP